MSASARAAESYGRILALLASRTHDIAAAEDALSDAFTKALSSWPSNGVPNDPSAWLFTVARNRLIDKQRHQTRFPNNNEIPEMPETLKEQDTSEAIRCYEKALSLTTELPLINF